MHPSDLKLGPYKSVRTLPVRCGLSVFILPAGMQVSLRQVDDTRHQALLQFGERDIDWYSYKWVSDNFRFVGD